MLLFETDRLHVKRFTSEDAEVFYQINSNPDTMRYIRPVKNRDESDQFLLENLQFYLDESVLGRFAVIEKLSNDIIGTFSFLYLSGDADFHMGYALLPDAWGKGYATELVGKGIDYFFQKTTYPTVYAITESENAASKQVLLNSGFQINGLREEYGKSLELFYLNRG